VKNPAILHLFDITLCENIDLKIWINNLAYANAENFEDYLNTVVVLTIEEIRALEEFEWKFGLLFSITVLLTINQKS
jgi:hypothetical protein